MKQEGEATSSSTVDFTLQQCSITSQLDFTSHNVKLIGVFEEDSRYLLCINLTSQKILKAYNPIHSLSAKGREGTATLM